MDLKVYYRNVRKIEEQIDGADAIIVSCETPDGGRAGVLSEVPKRMAAKLVTDGCARIASEESAMAYRERLEQIRQQALEERAANRVRVAVIPESELKAKRGVQRPGRA
jgi:hypothetical protein